MRIVVVLLLFFGVVQSVDAQMKVTGKVTSADNKALADVIVKITVKGKMLSYATTDANGGYCIIIKQNLPQDAVISFSHLSYESISEPIKPTRSEIMIKNKILKPQSVALRELRVKGQPVKIKGDTLSYNLASFLGKGDVTLEDGLKRLPGVSVANDGGINYMGRPISEFQIEGLNLLGGKYPLATQNMRTEHVTKVEILRGFNQHKIDKDEQSDDVALNVKLSARAKMKPIGTEETGAGYMQDGKDKMLGKLGLAGMLFAERFQTICSVKAGNYRDYGRNKWDMDVSTSATRLLPGWKSGESVPADHTFERNAMVSLNAIQKYDSLRRFRINADYCYHQQTAEAQTQSTYLGNDGLDITIGEHAYPDECQHTAKLSATYNEDFSNHYLYENFALKTKFEKDKGDMLYLVNHQEDDIVQHSRLSSFEASNEIRYAVRHGKHRTNLSSALTFFRTPTLHLNFEYEGKRAVQTAQSTTIDMKNSMDYSIKLGKGHRIHTPISIASSLEFIETEWRRTGLLSGHNRLHGGRMSPNISPSYDWTSADKQLYIQGGIPLTWNLFRLGNLSEQRLELSPDINIKYTFNANNKLELSSVYAQQTGDLTQMMSMQMTDTVQTSYRSYRAASTGIIGHDKNWRTSLDWRYQQPLSFFTLQASLLHIRSWRNMLSSQTVSGIDLTNTSLAHDSHSQSTKMCFSMSKNIPSIFTKFDLESSYTFGSTQMAVNGQMIEPHTCNVSYGTKISAMPITWIELKYDCAFERNRTTYNDISKTQTSFDQEAELHIFPVSMLDISAKYNYTRQEVASNQYTSLSLLGASVQWKYMKTNVFRFELNNLFNQRHYAYAVFDGVNTFSYDQYLCGRNIMFSVMMNL